MAGEGGNGGHVVDGVVEAAGESRRPTVVACQCMTCGVNFSVEPYRIRRGGGKYCSRKCRITQVEINCQQCNAAFLCPRPRLRERKFCSRRCAYLGMHRQAQKPLVDKYSDRIGSPDSNGCIPWIGHINSNGYGVLGGDGLLAHRIAYELAHGPIPSGLFVCHTCDNRKCCNPDHLFVGTNEDNMKDMASKGRAARGEKSARAKLMEADIRRIRLLAASGRSFRSIGQEYSIYSAYVSAIVSRKRWGHVV
jgi:hypothetical protein